MKLYYFKSSCALAPHIALEWAGAEYETEGVKRSATRSPEFLENINPYGKVPVLELDDGAKLSQVTTILMWIARHFPNADLGADEGEAGAVEMDAMLSHFNSDVHTAFTPYFLTNKYTTEEGHQQSVKDAVQGEIDFQLADLEQHMEGRDWVLGERRSILDTYLFVFCTWARYVPGVLDDKPNLKAFGKRMMADPAVESALKQQGMM
jgi:glutathione S-transferase